MGTSSVPSDLAVGHSVFFECRLPPAANFRTYKSLQFGFRVKGDSRLNRGFLSCSFVVKPICSRRRMRGAGEFGGVHVSGVEHRRGSDKGVAVSAGGENSTMNPNAQHAMVDSNSVESSIPSIICPPITSVGKSTNIVWQECSVNKEERQKLLRQKGCVIWITGLSGSGKSTLACALSRALHSRGRLTYILDGDNLRHGLNKNLSFSAEDRTENIRRIGEVARLFVDAGVICITSLISPYQRDRDACRALLPVGEFIEIFMDFPLEICEERDAKGLYKLARAGKIKYSRFLHTITSYLACIPIWSQLLTTGVAPDDYMKTPCPRMIQRTLVPSNIISQQSFLTLLLFFIIFFAPRFHTLRGIVISDTSNDEF